MTPLHLAAECGHIKKLNYLCDKGADINIQDNDGVILSAGRLEDWVWIGPIFMQVLFCCLKITFYLFIGFSVGCCINCIGYQIWVWKVTCQCCDWMLRLSSKRKWKKCKETLLFIAITTEDIRHRGVLQLRWRTVCWTGVMRRQGGRSNPHDLWPLMTCIHNSGWLWIAMFVRTFFTFALIRTGAFSGNLCK